MKFPWVSREQYDQLHDALTAERLRNQALFERYHELLTRPAGATASFLPLTTPGATFVPKLERERSPIAEAIREEAMGDPKLARFLSRRARELKSEKSLTEDEIAKQIRTWETSEDIAV